MLKIILLIFRFNSVRAQCPLVCSCDDHDKTANCESQELEAVPENLPWFVQDLSLSENKLNRIPKNAFPGKNNLLMLNFRNNELVDIVDGAFADQKKLKTLTLSNNLLTRVPTNGILSAKVYN